MKYIYHYTSLFTAATFDSSVKNFRFSVQFTRPLIFSYHLAILNEIFNLWNTDSTLTSIFHHISRHVRIVNLCQYSTNIHPFHTIKLLYPSHYIIFHTTMFRYCTVLFVITSWGLTLRNVSISIAFTIHLCFFYNNQRFLLYIPYGMFYKYDVT